MVTVKRATSRSSSTRKSSRSPARRRQRSTSRSRGASTRTRRRAAAKDLTITETCGALVQEYTVPSIGTSSTKKGTTSTTMTVASNQTLRSVRQFVTECFLPSGYPHSVSSDYLEYQVWDTLQALSSTLTGMLATHATLTGYGVGEASATATAATLQWIYRDGTGMLGRILFAWFQGSNLDANAKTWRLMADITNDMASFLDLFAPVYRTLFVPVACLASATRAVTAVAGGATRAAITQHQAQANNISDVAAKDGSQETAVNFMGLLLGIYLVPYITRTQTGVWLAFILFTCLHLFSNYRAVTCVVMKTLNRQRVQILLEEYMSGNNVSDPARCAKQERVFWWEYTHDSSPRIDLGTPLGNVARRTQDLEDVLNIPCASPAYIISATSPSYVSVCLAERGQDHLAAYFHAQVLRVALRVQARGIGVWTLPLQPSTRDLLAAVCDTSGPEKASLTQQLVGDWVVTHYPIFESALADAGWDLEHVQMGASDWRVNSDAFDRLRSM